MQEAVGAAQLGGDSCPCFRCRLLATGSYVVDQIGGVRPRDPGRLSLRER